MGPSKAVCRACLYPKSSQVLCWGSLAHYCWLSWLLGFHSDGPLAGWEDKEDIRESSQQVRPFLLHDGT